MKTFEHFSLKPSQTVVALFRHDERGAMALKVDASTVRFQQANHDASQPFLSAQPRIERRHLVWKYFALFGVVTVASILLKTSLSYSVGQVMGSGSVTNVTTLAAATYFSYSRIQQNGIGCPWMTSNTNYQITCADGTSGRDFDCCIDSGTFRTQCPVKTKACNEKAGNGDAFSCFFNCQGHGGDKPCYEPSVSELQKRLKWPFMTRGVVVKQEADGYPGYIGSNNAESCPSKWRVPKNWFMGKCPADEKRCTPFTNYSSHVAQLTKKRGYGDYQCILYEGDYTNARGLWNIPRTDTATASYYKDPKKPISRRQILERALGWVTKNWMYINIAAKYTPPFPTRMIIDGRLEDLSTVAKRRSGLNCVEACYEGQSDGCPQVWHGCDCCGMVAMSWRIENCARTRSTALRVRCEDLKPGDALSNSEASIADWQKPPSPCNSQICPWGSHIVLFRKWIGPKCVVGSKIEIYQSGGGGAKMNRYVGGPHGTWDPSEIYGMRRVNLEDP